MLTQATVQFRKLGTSDDVVRENFSSEAPILSNAIDEIKKKIYNRCDEIFDREWKEVEIKIIR